MCFHLMSKCLKRVSYYPKCPYKVGRLSTYWGLYDLSQRLLNNPCQQPLRPRLLTAFFLFFQISSVTSGNWYVQTRTQTTSFQHLFPILSRPGTEIPIDSSPLQLQDISLPILEDTTDISHISIYFVEISLAQCQSNIRIYLINSHILSIVLLTTKINIFF